MTDKTKGTFMTKPMTDFPKDFKDRLAEAGELCGRRFYLYVDGAQIGPFPDNGLAGEWGHRNLKTGTGWILREATD